MVCTTKSTFLPTQSQQESSRVVSSSVRQSNGCFYIWTVIWSTFACVSRLRSATTAGNITEIMKWTALGWHWNGSAWAGHFLLGMYVGLSWFFYFFFSCYFAYEFTWKHSITWRSMVVVLWFGSETLHSASVDTNKSKCLMLNVISIGKYPAYRFNNR